jgi:hypothetical protein
MEYVPYILSLVLFLVGCAVGLWARPLVFRPPRPAAGPVRLAVPENIAVYIAAAVKEQAEYEHGHIARGERKKQHRQYSQSQRITAVAQRVERICAGEGSGVPDDLRRMVKEALDADS